LPLVYFCYYLFSKSNSPMPFRTLYRRIFFVKQLTRSRYFVRGLVKCWISMFVLCSCMEVYLCIHNVEGKQICARHFQIFLIFNDYMRPSPDISGLGKLNINYICGLGRTFALSAISGTRCSHSIAIKWTPATPSISLNSSICSRANLIPSSA
jgi:hypothetical protein